MFSVVVRSQVGFLLGCSYLQYKLQPDLVVANHSTLWKEKDNETKTEDTWRAGIRELEFFTTTIKL
jgi:hypothetical protein